MRRNYAKTLFVVIGEASDSPDVFKFYRQHKTQSCNGQLKLTWANPLMKIDCRISKLQEFQVAENKTQVYRL